MSPDTTVSIVGPTTGVTTIAAITAAITATDVRVRRGGVRVLESVSCSAVRGEWLAVVGPNGAGKTTLLHVLGGLLPFEGHVTIAGRPLASLASRERAHRIALVPQSPSIPPGMTVGAYVLLGRTARLARFGGESAQDRRVVEGVLDRLAMSPFSERPLNTLSGGERQRACIARALAQESDVLLLDEPTAGLDLHHQLEVLDLVDELRRERGLTVVSTLHDLTLAAQYADHLLLLHEGRVAVSGRADEVLTESHLERHYGGRVRILRDGDHVIVVPLRRPSAAATPQS